MRYVDDPTLVGGTLSRDFRSPVILDLAAAGALSPPANLGEVAFYGDAWPKTVGLSLDAVARTPLRICPRKEEQVVSDEEQSFVKDRILIRVSYWVAAIVDFVVAVVVLIPERMGVTEFVYPMGLMSAVAFSWAVLLIVADRKPVERRWVLLPTTLVVFLLGVAGVYAASVGVIPVQRVMASSAAVVAVLLLLSYTSYRTRNVERANPPGVSE